MEKTFTTNRLHLTKLNEKHASFIMELVNTEGWLTYIGDRNVKSIGDALAYIQKITTNSNICYWVVSLKDTSIPIGLITLIKRDYLLHRDLGFAFLPGYANKGYAYEAATAVVDDITQDQDSSTLLAITMEENKNSIQLLLKLGFRFDKLIDRDGETLAVYQLN